MSRYIRLVYLECGYVYVRVRMVSLCVRLCVRVCVCVCVCMLVEICMFAHRKSTHDMLFDRIIPDSRILFHLQIIHVSVIL